MHKSVTVPSVIDTLSAPVTGLQVAVRFAGVDEAFYALMAAQLAASCGTKHFYGNSCPSSVSYPASDATACIGATPWPPIQQQRPTGSPTASAASPDDSQPQTASQGVGDVAVGGQVVCLANDIVYCGQHAGRPCESDPWCYMWSRSCAE